MAKQYSETRTTAERLYVEDNRTQLEIAEIFNVNIRTINSWSQDGKWKDKRTEFQTRPERIENNLLKRLATLSENLNDPEQADSYSKITNEIAQINKTLLGVRRDGNYPLIVYIRVLDQLANFTRLHHNDSHKSVAQIISHFTLMVKAEKEK